MGNTVNPQEFSDKVQRSDTSKNKDTKDSILRSVIIGTIFLIVTIILEVYMICGKIGPGIGGVGGIIPGSALVACFILMIVNVLMGLFGLKRFSKRELIVVYSIVGFGGLALEHAHLFVGIPMNVRYLLASRSDLAEYISISPLLLMKEDAILGYVTGESAVPWGSLLIPLILVGLFGLGIWLVQLCLAQLVTKQWNEIEHLSYPVTIPVYEMLDDKPFSRAEGMKFWRNPLTIVGIFFALIFVLPRDLNTYFSGVPYIPVQWNVRDNILQPMGGIWWIIGNQGNIRLPLDPLAFGLLYLSTTQVLFSFAFFWILYILRYVINELVFSNQAYISVGHMSNFSGFAAWGIFSLWMSRHQIKEFIGLLLKKNERHDSNDYPMSPLATLSGIVLGSGYCIFFLTYLLHIPLMITLPIFVITMFMALGVAKARAEAGMPWLTGLGGTLMMDFAAPNSLALTNTPLHYRVANLSVLSPWYSQAACGSTSAMGMDCYKLAERVGIKKRTMSKLLVMSIVIGTVLGFYFIPKLIYHYGTGNTLRSWTSSVYLEQFIERSIKGQTYFLRHNRRFILGSIIEGFIVTGILFFLRTRYYWFPLHPVGYMAAPIPVIREYGPIFLLVGFIKTLIYRWGGQQLYRILQPLFIGMVAGSVLNKAFWAIFALLTWGLQSQNLTPYWLM